MKALNLSITLLCLCASALQAQIHRITSIPYTISSPGIYVVDKDFVFTPVPGGHYYDKDIGWAIQITASNVLLDFRGHTLSDPATDSFYSESAGVFVGTNYPYLFPSSQTNVLVVNGTTHGFAYGVEGFANNLIVQNMKFYNNSQGGAFLEGIPNIIDGCQVYNCLISTEGYPLIATIGDNIALEGYDVRNCLVNVCPGGFAIAVSHLALNNTITDSYIGIAGFAEGAQAIHNKINGCDYAFQGIIEINNTVTNCLFTD
jgi:hypothetical protein